MEIDAIQQQKVYVKLSRDLKQHLRKVGNSVLLRMVLYKDFTYPVQFCERCFHVLLYHRGNVVSSHRKTLFTLQKFRKHEIITIILKRFLTLIVDNLSK